ncbi:hypothetical protein ACA910_001772 [Epithemia clementina (nom. ined.)]
MVVFLRCGDEENNSSFPFGGALGLLTKSSSWQIRPLPVFPKWELHMSPSPLFESDYSWVTLDEYAPQQQQLDQQQQPIIETGLRLNKVFRSTHSRRQADQLIAQGRVSINETSMIVEDMGRRVQPFRDRVYLDGKLYEGWEQRHGFVQATPKSNTKLTSNTGSKDSRLGTMPFNHHFQNEIVQEDYIKYWKPVGVVSTTDREVRNNLLSALEKEHQRRRQEQQRQYKTSEHELISSPTSNTKNNDNKIAQHRIFSVGRLDKDSSGLLLMTSDGRVPNAVLRKEFKQPKTYLVMVDKPVTNQDLDRLRHGIVITTDTVRNGKHVPLTARTLPCQVQRVVSTTADHDYDRRRTIHITLREGRNRQIRVMLQTLGYQVTHLHRTSFMGIDLNGLRGPGDFAFLTKSEVALVEAAVRKTSMSSQGAEAHDTKKGNRPSISNNRNEYEEW